MRSGETADRLLNLELLPVRPVDLQRFASAEQEGRTEKPTQRRLRESRRQGRVAKSPELAPALTMIVTALFLLFVGKRFYADLKVLVVRVFQNAATGDLTLGNMMTFLAPAGLILLNYILPLLILVFVVAAFAEILQVGFVFSLEPLKPTFNKISFTWEKFRTRVFFSRQTMVGLVKSIVKLAIISAIAWVFIQGSYGDLMRMIDYDIERSVGFIAQTSFKLIIWTGVLFVLLAVFDYFYQRFEFIESQKMTRFELKREVIEDEGNPLYKARLRDMFNEMLQRRKMLEEVPKADVVITNPTHYAVALKYESDQMKAPQVVAKGSDMLALKIKEIAFQSDVVIREDRMLARSLFETVEVGQPVPEEMYEVVAAIFRLVYEMKDRAATAAEAV
jgi:flagellar biosynthetic protein FlhB